MLEPRSIYSNLNKAITCVVQKKEKYLRNPLSDFTRTRKFTMESVINIILSMEGGSLKKELHDFSVLEKTELTPSAFIQQRAKISSNAFRDIFRIFNDNSKDNKKYRGYRVFAVDGSVINQYRNPESENFMVTNQVPNGFNQIHLNVIYDLCNKTYMDALLQPRAQQNERHALITMLQRNNFVSKNLIITDRGYESYNMFAHLINTNNVDFLCRVKHGSGAMFEVSNLPMAEMDIDANIELTTTQTNEDKKHNRRFIQTGSKKGKINSPKTCITSWDFPSPYTLKFRIVRFLLPSGEYETIATSLSRDEFSISDISELYHMRWGIETSFRELKYAVGLINSHCKKDDFVKQEIYAALIMYNYCSRIASKAILRKRDKTVYAYRVDFTMSIHLCKSTYKSDNKDFIQLLTDIGKYSEPIRPGRHDKRKMTQKKFAGFTYRVAA